MAVVAWPMLGPRACRFRPRHAWGATLPSIAPQGPAASQSDSAQGIALHSGDAARSLSSGVLRLHWPNATRQLLPNHDSSWA